MTPPLHWLTAAIVAVLACQDAAAQPAAISGSATIIDGDTLEIGPITIRINGIDAAELGQHCKTTNGGTWPCDEAAADRLAQLVGASDIRCVPLDRDAYNRIIAQCFVGDVDVASDLVSDGLAWAFVRYSDDYVAEEQAARDRSIGIWQAPTQTPWDYRANRWERASEEAPRPGCPIKGNISREGERIYHTPWSPWYTRTQINEAAGERWFCDEAEAIQAGWRPARFR